MREWLQRNRVFFETVGIIAVGIIGIFIAIEANQISKIQTSIQAQLTRLQSPPVIELKTSNVGENKVFEKTKTYYALPSIEIFNTGGNVLNVDIEPILFIDLVGGPPTDSACLVTVTVAPFEYVTNLEDRLTGKVLEVWFPQSSEVQSASKKFDREDKEKDTQYVALWELFIKISYFDGFSREGQTYFSIREKLGTRRIGRSHWDAVVRKFRELKTQGAVVNFQVKTDDEFSNYWKKFLPEEGKSECIIIGGPQPWRSRVLETR